MQTDRQDPDMADTPDQTEQVLQRVQESFSKVVQCGQLLRIQRLKAISDIGRLEELRQLLESDPFDALKEIIRNKLTFPNRQKIRSVPWLEELFLSKTCVKPSLNPISSLNGAQSLTTSEVDFERELYLILRQQSAITTNEDAERIPAHPDTKEVLQNIFYPEKRENGAPSKEAAHTIGSSAASVNQKNAKRDPAEQRAIRAMRERERRKRIREFRKISGENNVGTGIDGARITGAQYLNTSAVPGILPPVVAAANSATFFLRAPNNVPVVRNNKQSSKASKSNSKATSKAGKKSSKIPQKKTMAMAKPNSKRNVKPK